VKAEILIPHIRESIRVAAKAGFISKRIWKEFFAGSYPRWRNRQWQALNASGFFAAVPDYGFVDSAVTLTNKGKAQAVSLGLDPVYSPHAKNLWHDEELIRFALFLERREWISWWMTEQELKVGTEGKKFLATTEHCDKIPDLIIQWRGLNVSPLWAVELERTRKEFTRYYRMVGAYQGFSRLDSVLVIAATNSIEANIKKAQARLNYPQQNRPMIFASMNDVIADPASSELRIGQTRMQLEDMANMFIKKSAKALLADGKQHSPSDSPGRAVGF
jgi:hypothetical protein